MKDLKSLVKRMVSINESINPKSTAAPIVESATTKIVESFTAKQDEDETWSVVDGDGAAKESGLTEEDAKSKAEELNKE